MTFGFRSYDVMFSHLGTTRSTFNNPVNHHHQSNIILKRHYLGFRLQAPSFEKHIIPAPLFTPPPGLVTHDKNHTTASKVEQRAASPLSWQRTAYLQNSTVEGRLCEELAYNSFKLTGMIWGGSVKHRASAGRVGGCPGQSEGGILVTWYPKANSRTTAFTLTRGVIIIPTYKILQYFRASVLKLWEGSACPYP